MAKNVTKIVAGALAVVGAYFVFKYFQKQKTVKRSSENNTDTTKDTTPKPTNGFPLKKGSSGRMVSSIQQWILKIDPTLLPKYGADGKFGSETESALNKLIGKKTVDSNSDIDKLILKSNQKNFPLVTSQAGGVFPVFKPFGTI
ncbi:MAG: hypothetical protein FJY17_00120 [Bacteroidetes bacterium]|nr:hypothetical protein [Bacteroidota bacterium]